jgi:membrane-bound serine protease (ClpP class)
VRWGYGDAVLLVVALVLALLYLEWPWNFVVILLAAVCEVAEAVVGIRYTRRRRAGVGVETLVGASARVISPLAPDGQVKVNGEIWQAHSKREARVGELVRIVAVNRLTLDVEPLQESTLGGTTAGKGAGAWEINGVEQSL